MAAMAESASSTRPPVGRIFASDFCMSASVFCLDEEGRPAESSSAAASRCIRDSIRLDCGSFVEVPSEPFVALKIREEDGKVENSVPSTGTLVEVPLQIFQDRLHLLGHAIGRRCGLEQDAALKILEQDGKQERRTEMKNCVVLQRQNILLHARRFHHGRKQRIATLG